jgi:hypothetical protein
MKRIAPLASCVAVVLMASCGARTGLFAPEDDTAGAAYDASLDAPSDAVVAMVGCTPGAVTLSAAEPEVMFVLDRSGSMNMAFEGNDSRWTVLTNALAATLPPVNDTMAIGALLFPSGSSMDDCSLPGTPNLAPALDHVQALLTLLEATRPGGATPTAVAIDTASSLLLGVRAATTARALVLATDGAPNCNASLNVNTCTCATGAMCRGDPDRCLDDTRTVAQIASVAAQGIPTYVIGIASAGDGVFSTVLDEMAVAGGRPLTGGATSYYPALSEADLETAVSTIRDQVGACTYLTTSVPSASGSIALTFDGMTVPYDPDGGSGWSWSSKSNGEILLLGATCSLVAGSPTGTLVANVTCGDGDAGDDEGGDGEAGGDAGEAGD